ncbi:MAG TPA: class II aldolase/adducin family protein, partial [Chloroflexota bacterium]
MSRQKAPPKTPAVDPRLELFQAVGRDLYLTGLVSSHTGTMSVRDSETGIKITKQNAMLGRLTNDDLIELPAQGEVPELAPLDGNIHR